MNELRWSITSRTTIHYRLTTWIENNGSDTRNKNSFEEIKCYIVIALSIWYIYSDNNNIMDLLRPTSDREGAFATRSFCLVFKDLDLVSPIFLVG